LKGGTLGWSNNVFYR